MPPRLLGRRRFLGALAGLAAAALAACAEAPRTIAPSGTSAATSSPSSSPRPTPTPRSSPPLRSRLGQLLLVGFRGMDALEAEATLRDIRERGLGGVVLFDRDQPTGRPVRNVTSPEQLRGLTAALHAAGSEAAISSPLLVAVDEEGGRVARLNPGNGFAPTMSAAALGAMDDPATTEAAGEAIGATLASVGVNLNLAPVVDLNVNPDNPIIGSLDRSFGADPALVTRQAAAFIAGHRAAGVRTALKHFPGHGSSTGDTHLGVVDVTDTWTDTELEPFANLVRDDLADAVLTAHVFNARLDPTYPATLSAATIDGILRAQIGFDGVVISDDLQMGAIRDAFGYEEAVALAIEAGVDILTIANQQVFEDDVVERTIGIIAAHLESGRLSEERIERSLARIAAFKAGLVQ